MADDPFDFLDAPEGATEAAAEVAIPEAPAAPSAEGAETPAVTPPASQHEGGQVPLATLLDLRDKLKIAERRAKDLEDAQPKPSPPSFQNDPAGWEARQQQAIRDVEVKTTMALSGRFAAQQHGPERVQAAMAWGSDQNQNDPTFGQRFMSQADPYGWLVQQHQRDQTLSKIGGKSFEEAAKEWAESQGFVAGAAQQPTAAQAQAKPAVPATPATTAPPRSLASVPAAGGGSKSAPSDQEIMDAAFS